MQRRDFISLLSSAVTAWPLTARTQQPTMPVIGFLHAGSAIERAHAVASFQKGLAEAGYVENRNVVFEFRWADGQFHRLPGLAADLAGREVALIAAFGNAAARAVLAGRPIKKFALFRGGGLPIKGAILQANIGLYAVRSYASSSSDRGLVDRKSTPD